VGVSAGAWVSKPRPLARPQCEWVGVQAQAGPSEWVSKARPVQGEAWKSGGPQPRKLGGSRRRKSCSQARPRLATRPVRD